MGPATLYLVRHGATDWNEAGRWQGQSDVPLNARGRDEALAAARLLAAWGAAPAAVYSSDLSRAVETARVIATTLGPLPLVLDARLRERALGAAEGLTRAELEARFGRADSDLAAVGAEPREALFARFDQAVGDITARHPARALVVVSHAGAMANWLRRRVEDYPAVHPGPLVNGEVIPLRREGGRWLLLA